MPDCPREPEHLLEDAEMRVQRDKKRNGVSKF